jgi:hypothetical protein
MKSEVVFSHANGGAVFNTPVGGGEVVIFNFLNTGIVKWSFEPYFIPLFCVLNCYTHR